MSLAAELNAFPLSLSLAQLQTQPQLQLHSHYCQRNHDHYQHDYHCRFANPLAVLAKLLSWQQKVPPLAGYDFGFGFGFGFQLG